MEPPEEIKIIWNKTDDVTDCYIEYKNRQGTYKFVPTDREDPKYIIDFPQFIRFYGYDDLCDLLVLSIDKPDSLQGYVYKQVKVNNAENRRPNYKDIEEFDMERNLRDFA